MAGLDVMLTATQPAEAAKIDELPKWDLFDRPNFTMPFNVAGYPAIAVCAGFGDGGLPVAIQLVGKPFREPTLFRIADAFEKTTPFRGQRRALIAAWDGIGRRLPPDARYSSSGSGYWAGALPAASSNRGSLTFGSFGFRPTSSTRNTHSSP
jgi:hypothetical protein